MSLCRKLAFSIVCVALLGNSVAAYAGPSSEQMVYELICKLFLGVEPVQIPACLREDAQLPKDLDVLHSRVLDTIAVGRLGRWMGSMVTDRVKPYSKAELYKVILDCVEPVIGAVGMRYIQETPAINQSAAQQALQKIIQEVRLAKQRNPSFECYNGQAIFGGRLGTSLRREIGSAFNAQQSTASIAIAPMQQCQLCRIDTQNTLPCCHKVVCLSCVKRGSCYWDRSELQSGTIQCCSCNALLEKNVIDSMIGSPIVQSAPVPAVSTQAKPIFTANECETCFEGFCASRQPVTLPCGHHVYCADCMNHWFNTGHATCPKCRHAMTNYEFELHIRQALQRQA